MKTGIELITEERLEQIEKHGYTSEHDKLYTSGELSDAALFAITGETKYYPSDWERWLLESLENKTPKECLIIAGALIAAEIDRLNQ